MNTYQLKIIKCKSWENVDEYNKAWEDAKPIICHGLQQVWQECGGKLPKQRIGWGGTDGTYEFWAVRV